jgi:hypothetical protein
MLAVADELTSIVRGCAVLALSIYKENGGSAICKIISPIIGEIR